MDYIADFSFNSGSSGRRYRVGDEISEYEYSRLSISDKLKFSEKRKKRDDYSPSSSDHTPLSPYFSSDDSPSPSHSAPSWDFGGGDSGGGGSSGSWDSGGSDSGGGGDSGGGDGGGGD